MGYKILSFYIDWFCVRVGNFRCGSGSSTAVPLARVVRNAWALILVGISSPVFYSNVWDVYVYDEKRRDGVYVAS